LAASCASLAKLCPGFKFASELELRLDHYDHQASNARTVADCDRFKQRLTSLRPIVQVFAPALEDQYWPPPPPPPTPKPKPPPPPPPTPTAAPTPKQSANSLTTLLMPSSTTQHSYSSIPFISSSSSSSSSSSLSNTRGRVNAVVYKVLKPLIPVLDWVLEQDKRIVIGGLFGFVIFCVFITQVSVL
jgi:hypothetical protein